MKTFEYRMRPNKKQEQALMNVLIASRKMYNACLEELITHYQETGKYLHLYEQDKHHAKRHILICLLWSWIPPSNVFTARLPTSSRDVKKDARLAFLALRVPTHGIPFSSVMLQATSRGTTFMLLSCVVVAFASSCIALWRGSSSLLASSCVLLAGISNVSVRPDKNPCRKKTMPSGWT